MATLLRKPSRLEDTQRGEVLRRTAVRPNAELPGIAEPKVERVSLKITRGDFECGTA